jgi:Ca-activated chloride channel family protein
VTAILSWQHPLAFVALLLLPGLAAFLAWAWRQRAKALDAFVASSLLPIVAPEVDPRRRTRRAGLRVGAVGLLIVALAGPMWGFRWEEVKREGIDLMIALDTSRSMLTTDVKPNRLTRAKLGIQDLLAETQGDRVGLIAFAGTAFVQCPLTLDHGAFLQSLEACDVGIIPRGGTDLASAIDAALGAFEGRQGNNQALVLITDGESQEGDWKAAVGRAKERGLRIFTVGIGTTEGELVPGEGGGFFKDRKGQAVTSRLDETTLQQIAVDTGGVYLHAAGASMGLTELYRDHIATMDKRELESTLERRWEPRFQVPLALALLLLLIEPFVDERRQVQRARRRGWRLRGAAAAVVLAMLSVGWLDPHANGREGNRLYAEGKFDDAAKAYNQGLVDDPDSAPLHFNLGDAQYEAKQYDAALSAYGRVGADPARKARVDYNVGNVKYRQGAAVEGAEPQKAIEHWTEALVAYRRALGVDPDDHDAKFNYELVLAKIKALQKKLEEQKQQQQQDQQQKNDDRQKQDQEQQKDEQKQDQADQQQRQDQQKDQQQEQKDQQQRQAEQQPEDQDQKDRQQQQAQQADQQQKDAEQRQAQAGEAGEGDDEMTRDEAAALLDSQRDQEVQPDEVVRRMQGAGVAEPARDW